MIPFNVVPLAIIAAAIVALFVAWQSDRAIQRARGAAIEVQKMERRADVNARKAETARRAADQLPADSLRDAHFRD